MVAVAIVGSTAPSGGSLGLVHLWLVGVVIDVILTLRRRTRHLNHTDTQILIHKFTGLN